MRYFLEAEKKINIDYFISDSFKKSYLSEKWTIVSGHINATPEGLFLTPGTEILQSLSGLYFYPENSYVFKIGILSLKIMEITFKAFSSNGIKIILGENYFKVYNLTGSLLFEGDFLDIRFPGDLFVFLTVSSITLAIGFLDKDGFYRIKVLGRGSCQVYLKEEAISFSIKNSSLSSEDLQITEFKFFPEVIREGKENLSKNFLKNQFWSFYPPVVYPFINPENLEIPGSFEQDLENQKFLKKYGTLAAEGVCLNLLGKPAVKIKKIRLNFNDLNSTYLSSGYFSIHGEFLLKSTISSTAPGISSFRIYRYLSSSKLVYKVSISIRYFKDQVVSKAFILEAPSEFTVEFSFSEDKIMKIGLYEKGTSNLLKDINLEPVYFETQILDSSVTGVIQSLYFRLGPPLQTQFEGINFFKISLDSIDAENDEIVLSEIEEEKKLFWDLRELGEIKKVSEIIEEVNEVDFRNAKSEEIEKNKFRKSFEIEYDFVENREKIQEIFDCMKDYFIFYLSDELMNKSPVILESLPWEYLKEKMWLDKIILKFKSLEIEDDVSVFLGRKVDLLFFEKNISLYENSIDYYIYNKGKKVNLISLFSGDLSVEVDGKKKTLKSGKKEEFFDFLDGNFKFYGENSKINLLLFWQEE